MTIPESLTRFCQTHGRLNALVVLSHCKEIYGGFTKSFNVGRLVTCTGLSVATIRRCLAWLRKKNWVGKQGHTWYFRAWLKIQSMEDMTHRRSWKIAPGTASEMIKEFHAGILGGLIRWQKAEYNRRDKKTKAYSRRTSSSQIGDISVTYCAKALKISRSKAWRVLKSAVSGGHLVRIESSPVSHLNKMLFEMESRTLDPDPRRFGLLNPTHKFECILDLSITKRKKRTSSFSVWPFDISK